jgi:hypothetical protein
VFFFQNSFLSQQRLDPNLEDYRRHTGRIRGRGFELRRCLHSDKQLPLKESMPLTANHRRIILEPRRTSDTTTPSSASPRETTPTKTEPSTTGVFNSPSTSPASRRLVLYLCSLFSLQTESTPKAPYCRHRDLLPHHRPGATVRNLPR